MPALFTAIFLLQTPAKLVGGYVGKVEYDASKLVATSPEHATMLKIGKNYVGHLVFRLTLRADGSYAASSESPAGKLTEEGAWKLEGVTLRFKSKGGKLDAFALSKDGKTFSQPSFIGPKGSLIVFRRG